ncbi:ABC-2 family transporter protein [Longilinea arvoryzae]|uniref:ABC-2 family transporter protein n=1 Tax=Longilinea arvoryzae TaxID=360412 RepID=A0A0K8MY28_9CHLR|nr:ABC transporter permease subunit [Longilinea arvoryzae]GAP16110.1 ABC-2 family transporter protein [Longilinea arvoryzae]
MTDRIRTIMGKEWTEVFKNKMVLFTVLFMPLLFTALPLIMLGTMSGSVSADGADMTDMPAQFARACAGLSSGDCMQAYLMNEFMLLFMMMPLIIPITIAAYSVVGEKATRSLEPLLATPITTEELLAGKGLAAVIPGVLATWLCFGIFLLLLPVVGVSARLFAYITGPTWLLAVLVAGPLMAVMAVNFALIVSSRVNDPRVAEQLSTIIILPLLAVLFGSLAGIIILNVTNMLIGILIIVVVDVALIWVGARLFQREVILTRWK